jgi:hypothetical protein
MCKGAILNITKHNPLAAPQKVPAHVVVDDMNCQQPPERNPAAGVLGVLC